MTDATPDTTPTLAELEAAILTLRLRRHPRPNDRDLFADEWMDRLAAEAKKGVHS